MYTLLIWLSTRMLLQRKLNTRVNLVMFCIISFMYVLSAAYWAYNVADGLDRMMQSIELALHPLRRLPDHTAVTMWSPLFNAVTLINYVLSDGVVVWRAWVICLRKHRKYLWIAMGFLAVTAITVVLTIALRIAGLVQSPIASLPSGSSLARAIDILQVTTLVTSLLSNLTATGVVGATALQHWRTIRAAFSSEKKTTRTNHILLLVVESGVIYCISAIIVLLSAIIRLPQGTLGDLYTPVNVQIAGAYPTVVLLLVSTQRSLNESTFTDDTFVQSGSAVSLPPRFGTSGSGSRENNITFAPNPALSKLRDIVLDNSIRPEGEKGRNPRLSDDSFA
ncbi:hypothetical protein B0H11DRAFT_2000846 [Mycena galericulata]|nr:hypothetical protein B0H11DRAFT_2000846 [Mycena galericulata]